MDFFKDFLTSFIGSSHYEIQLLKGDASSRQYYRIRSDEKSWVLMVWETFTDSKRFPFLSVHQYFQDSGVRVPELYCFSSEKGLFLIEDLGDLSLEKYFWNCFHPGNPKLDRFGKNSDSLNFPSKRRKSLKGTSKENLFKMYTKAVDQLVRIHSLCFEEKNQKFCTAYEQEFSVEKLLWELNFSKNHLLKGLLEVSISEAAEKMLEKEFEDLCTKLYSSPQVICHRDFHSRNVMVQSGEVVIIDFQDARMGPVAYDLVSLFHDSYVCLDSSFIRCLMDYYRDHFPYFKRLGLGEECWQRLFEQQILQRCFKACGSFAGFKRLGNNSSYLSYIGPTLRLVLEKLKNQGDYPVWESLLERSKPKWRKL